MVILFSNFEVILYYILEIINYTHKTKKNKIELYISLF